VVDAIDRRLGEHVEQAAVERACRNEIAPEGLLDDDSRAFAGMKPRESRGHRPKHARRDREVVKRRRRLAQCTAEPLEGFGRPIVAIDVLEQAAELAAVLRFGAVRAQAVAHVSAQAVDAPRTPCDADDRDVELSRAHQRLQRGVNFFRREITGGAEQHERVAVSMAHGAEVCCTRMR
jgi:hypothetical protein